MVMNIRYRRLQRSAPQARSMRYVASGLVFACLLPFLPTLGFAADASPVLQEPISPIPLTNDLDQRKVNLGRRLFNDSRLSGDHGNSCASCHMLTQGLSDGLALSRGLPGYPGVTNTLSLFNIGLSSKFSWSGTGALTLEERTANVIVAKNTMDANWDDVLAIFNGDKGMAGSFNAIYGDGINRDNIIDALATYQRSLNTPNAPFDRYLRGDNAAISEGAKIGYQLFKDYGCVSCHQGVNVGENMLQVFGIFDKPQATANAAKTPGSAQDSGIADNRPVFRVPSLRNVAHTAPYFHDGSVKTLHDAITIMAKNQLGRSIDDDDEARLEDFLRSLTGEYQGISLDKM